MKRAFVAPWNALEKFSATRGRIALLAAIIALGGIPLLFLFLSQREDLPSPSNSSPAGKAASASPLNSLPKQQWTFPPAVNTSVEDFFSPRTATERLALNKYYLKHPEVLLLREHVSELRRKLQERQTELQRSLPPERYRRMIAPISEEETALEDEVLVPVLIMGMMSSQTRIGDKTLGSISTDLVNNTNYLEIVRPGLAAQVRDRFGDDDAAERIGNSQTLRELGERVGPYVDVLIEQTESEEDTAEIEFRLERRLLKAMNELEWNYTRSFTEDIPQ